MSPHPIVHIEFAAEDREKSGKFYEELFGWQIQHMPEFNYTTFSTMDNDQAVGGGGIRVLGVAPKRLVGVLPARPLADHQQVPRVVDVDQHPHPVVVAVQVLAGPLVAPYAVGR